MRSRDTPQIPRGGSVRGTVKDAAGEPIPGANVRIEGDGGSRPLTSTAQSDGTGAFELNGVPPGRMNVRATHPAYAAARVSGVVVDAEGGPAEAHLVMTRGGRFIVPPGVPDGVELWTRYTMQF